MSRKLWRIVQLLVAIAMTVILVLALYGTVLIAQDHIPDGVGSIVVGILLAIGLAGVWMELKR